MKPEHMAPTVEEKRKRPVRRLISERLYQLPIYERVLDFNTDDGKLG